MPEVPARFSQAVQALADEQDGVVTRGQLLALGLTRAQVFQPVRVRRWQQLHSGVYAVFTGPVPDRTRIHAAVLAAGPGAVAGHQTALWLAGFLPHAPDVVQICIPVHRRIRSLRGARITCRRGLATAIQPGSSPPRTGLDATVLDVADTTASTERVITLVLAAIQRRFTTAERLRAELSARARHRWRHVIREVLAEATAGVASTLERRYLRDVERPHGLPAGDRNQPETVAGKRRYRDVRYTEWGVVAELDGKEAHPAHEAFRDRRRDNRVAEDNEVCLRYGWADVAAHPCAVARQVAVVLRLRGWTGTLRPCPRCPS